MPPKTDYVALVANLMTIVISVSALFYAAKRFFYDRKLDVRRAWIWHLSKGQINVPIRFRVLVVIGFWKSFQNLIVADFNNRGSGDNKTAAGGNEAASGDNKTASGGNEAASHARRITSEFIIGFRKHIWHVLGHVFGHHFDSYKKMIRYSDWLDRISDRHDVIAGNDIDDYFLEILTLWVKGTNSSAAKPVSGDNGDEGDERVAQFLQLFSFMLEEKPHWFTISAKFAPKPGINSVKQVDNRENLCLQDCSLPWKSVYEALKVFSYFFRRFHAQDATGGQDWPTKLHYFVLLGHMSGVSPEEARICVNWLTYASRFFKLEFGSSTVETTYEKGVVLVSGVSGLKQKQFASKTYQTMLRALCDHFNHDKTNPWCLLAKILLDEVNNCSLFSEVNTYSRTHPNEHVVLKELYYALAKQIAPDGTAPTTDDTLTVWAKSQLLCAEQVYYATVPPHLEAESYVDYVSKTINNTDILLTEKQNQETLDDRFKEIGTMTVLLATVLKAEGQNELVSSISKTSYDLTDFKLTEYKMSLDLLEASIAATDKSIALAKPNEPESLNTIKDNLKTWTSSLNTCMPNESSSDRARVALLIQTALADIELAECEEAKCLKEPIKTMESALVDFDKAMTALAKEIDSNNAPANVYTSLHWSQEHQYARAMLAFLKVLECDTGTWAEKIDLLQPESELSAKLVRKMVKVPSELAALFTTDCIDAKHPTDHVWVTEPWLKVTICAILAVVCKKELGDGVYSCLWTSCESEYKKVEEQKDAVKLTSYKKIDNPNFIAKKTAIRSPVLLKVRCLGRLCSDET